MNIRSAKAKGRRLVIETIEIIESVFPELKGHLFAPVTSCPGADIYQSPEAKQKLPLVFELKNQERVNIWAAIAQAKTHTKDGRCPTVVISRNREPEPYAVLSLRDLLGLIKK